MELSGAGAKVSRMTLTERIASLQVDTHSDRSTISVPALQILGQLAERHFVAILAALERPDADAGELRQLAETLDALVLAYFGSGLGLAGAAIWLRASCVPSCVAG